MGRGEKWPKQSWEEGEIGRKSSLREKKKSKRLGRREKFAQKVGRRDKLGEKVGRREKLAQKVGRRETLAQKVGIEEGEIGSKSREQGEIGSESREKCDLPPCPPLIFCHGALSKHAQNILGNATSNRTSFKKSVFGKLTNSTNRTIIFRQSSD